jgi:hypothetical protein
VVGEIGGLADGGRSWQTLIDPFQGDLQSCGKTGIVFADPQLGWITGDCHAVAPGVFLYRTEDGGHTWNTQEIPAPAGATTDLFNQPYIGCGTYDPNFAPPNNIILNLRCDNFESSTTDYYVYRTTDGGRIGAQTPSLAILYSSTTLRWVGLSPGRTARSPWYTLKMVAAAGRNCSR